MYSVWVISICLGVVHVGLAEDVLVECLADDRDAHWDSNVRLEEIGLRLHACDTNETED